MRWNSSSILFGQYGHSLCRCGMTGRSQRPVSILRRWLLSNKVSNFITRTMVVIPCWDQSQSMLVKGAQVSLWDHTIHSTAGSRTGDLYRINLYPYLKWYWIWRMPGLREGRRTSSLRVSYAKKKKTKKKKNASHQKFCITLPFFMSMQRFDNMTQYVWTQRWAMHICYHLINGIGTPSWLFQPRYAEQGILSLSTLDL